MRKIDLDAALVSDSGQMKHGVSGASDSHIGSERILECFCSKDISGSDILLNTLHYLHTCMLSKLDPCGIYGRDSTVALKTKTQYLS